MNVSSNLQKSVLIPLFLVILLLGSEAINHLIQDRDLANEVQARAIFVEQANDLVHQLQRERGYSSGFVASAGKYLQTEMVRERQITDRILAFVLTRWTSDNDPLVSRETRATLSVIDDWRSQIDAMRFTSADVLAHYTGLVDDLLGATELHSISVSRDALPLLIEARQAIAQAKEAAGLQRAAGSMALGAHTMDKGLHQRLLSLAAREETFLDLAYLKAEGAGRPLKVLKTRQFEQMNGVRKQLIDMGYGSDQPDMSAQRWFVISSAWVDRLRIEENRLNVAIAHVSANISDDANDALILRGLCVLFAMMSLAYQFRTRRPLTGQGHAHEPS